MEFVSILFYVLKGVVLIAMITVPFWDKIIVVIKKFFKWIEDEKR